ncbi:MAG: hypothetical protein RLY93_03125 [Sumerlaeia bacterium]
MKSALSRLLFCILIFVPVSLRAQVFLPDASIDAISGTLFRGGTTVDLTVTVKNDGFAADFRLVVLETPGGWSISPTTTPLRGINGDDEDEFDFRLTVPNNNTGPRELKFRLDGTDDLQILRTGIDERTFTIEAVSLPDNLRLDTPIDGAPGIQQPTTFAWQNLNSPDTTYTFRLLANGNGQAGEELYRRDNITATSFSLTEEAFRLTPGQTYFWEVIGRTPLGDVEPLEPFFFVMRELPALGRFNWIEPAQDGEFVSVTPTFSWSASTNAQRYQLRVFRGLDAPNDDETVIDTVLTGTGYTVPEAMPLAPGDYSAFVAAQAEGRTDLGPDEGFRLFTVTRLGEFELLAPGDGELGLETLPVFSWTAADRAEAYIVEVKRPPQEGSGVVTRQQVAGDVTSQRLAKSLTRGTEYRWQVYAVADGREKASNSPERGFRTSPLVPFPLISPERDATDVPVNPRFQWVATLGAATYTLQVATSVNGQPNLQDVRSQLVPSPLQTTVDNPFGELARGSQYFWRVVANSAPQPPSQQTVVLESLGGFTPFQVLDLTPFGLRFPNDNAVGVTTDTMLFWDEVGTAEHYRIHLTLQGLGTLPPVETGNDAGSYPLAGLNLRSESDYTWTVEAVNANGSLMASETFRFRTAALPDRPVNSQSIAEQLLGTTWLTDGERAQVDVQPRFGELNIADFITYRNALE